jgi:hypothetical protein
VIAFGLSYFFWLIFYFDFLKKSLESVARLAEPSALIFALLGMTGLFCVLALLVAVVTWRVGDRSFVRGVVIIAALLNLSSLISIGLKSPLAWGSLALTAIALLALWRVSGTWIVNVALVCGTLVTGYVLIDQGLWAWSYRPKTEPLVPTTPASSTNMTLPSVYVVVMDEFPLSLINSYASFMSLPNLSRLAREGIFFPRAYAIADATEWSIPAFLTGRYLEQEQVAGKPLVIAETPYRNLAADLMNLGYRLKVYNDVAGISSGRLASASRLETGTETITEVSSRELVVFAVKQLGRQITFGLYNTPNIGGLLHGQGAKVFYLDHQRDYPQFVYIHLFDAHHSWVRNRDGSFHGSPYVTFYGSDRDRPEDAPKVAENAFEQYLWADNVIGPLVNDLLSIPPDERIVVFLSDHGISWREPPFGRGHGILHSTQIQVPVALVAPGIDPGIEPDLFPLIDLYPTLVDLINRFAGETVIKPPEGIDGLSLFADQGSRQTRCHYAYSGSCQYRLEEENWVFEKGLRTNAVGASAPIPAEELAATPEAVQRALQATAPRPIPPLSPERQVATAMAPEPALLVENYRGFTVISAYGNNYGFPRPDGPLEAAEVYLRGITDGDYFPVYTGKTVSEVADAIDSNPYIGPFAETLIMVEAGYKGFDILANRGTLYAVLQAEGKFDYQRLKNGPYAVLLSGRTLEEVKNKIDNYSPTSSSSLAKFPNLLTTNPDFETGNPPVGWEALDSQIGQESATVKSGLYSLKLTANRMEDRILSPNLLASNADFEVGNPPAGWNTFDCKIEQEDSVVKAGEYSLRVTAGKPVFGDAGAHQDAFKPEYRGQTFTFGAWVLAPATNDKTQTLGIWDSVSASYSEPVPHDGKWHWVTITKTIDQNASELQVYAYVLTGSEPDSDDVLYVDSVVLWRGACAPRGAGVSQNVFKPEYRGQTFTFGAWVLAPTSDDEMQSLGIWDGISAKYSEPVPHDGKWHWVTVTKSIAPDASELYVYVFVLTGSEPDNDDILYVDSAVLAPVDYLPEIY